MKNYKNYKIRKTRQSITNRGSQVGMRRIVSFMKTLYWLFCLATITNKIFVYINPMTTAFFSNFLAISTVLKGQQYFDRHQGLRLKFVGIVEGYLDLKIEDKNACSLVLFLDVENRHFKFC